MQSPKKAFAALCMHQGHATVRSGSNIGRITSQPPGLGFLDSAHPPLSNGKMSDRSRYAVPEGLLKTSNMEHNLEWKQAHAHQSKKTCTVYMCL